MKKLAESYILPDWVKPYTIPEELAHGEQLLSTALDVGRFLINAFLDQCVFVTLGAQGALLEHYARLAEMKRLNAADWVKHHPGLAEEAGWETSYNRPLVSYEVMRTPWPDAAEVGDEYRKAADRAFGKKDRWGIRRGPDA